MRVLVITAPPGWGTVKRVVKVPFSQFGTKVIPTTARNATYVLDEILDNETELPLLEHTTDTAGYTEIIFVLFDLLGLQFARVSAT